MSREDNWVAVAPEFATASNTTTEIRKPQSAYQFFQKDISSTVKAEIVRANGGAFDLAQHGRAVRDRWKALTDTEREPYLVQQRTDAARFAQESHQADVAALERREQRQQEHNSIGMGLM